MRRAGCFFINENKAKPSIKNQASPALHSNGNKSHYRIENIEIFYRNLTATASKAHKNSLK
ncbi:hypothetical protein HpSP79_18110 [Helicobacter pylori]